MYESCVEGFNFEEFFEGMLNHVIIGLITNDPGQVNPLRFYQENQLIEI